MKFLKLNYIVFFVIISFLFINISATEAKDLEGYAWSSNIGWISFNCDNFGATSCRSSNYKVSLDDGTNILSGYAWSSNIGWISFNDDLSGCPSGALRARVDSSGNINGWFRAISGKGRTDGWDGCIKSIDLKYQSSNGDFKGYAWGSEVVGWIQFNPFTSGNPNNVHTGSGASCALSAYQDGSFASVIVDVKNVSPSNAYNLTESINGGTPGTVKTFNSSSSYYEQYNSTISVPSGGSITYYLSGPGITSCSSTVSTANTEDIDLFIGKTGTLDTLNSTNYNSSVGSKYKSTVLLTGQTFDLKWYSSLSSGYTCSPLVNGTGSGSNWGNWSSKSSNNIIDSSGGTPSTNYVNSLNTSGLVGFYTFSLKCEKKDPVTNIITKTVEDSVDLQIIKPRVDEE